MSFIWEEIKKPPKGVMRQGRGRGQPRVSQATGDHWGPLGTSWGSANCSPPAKSSQTPVFVNRIFMESTHPSSLVDVLSATTFFCHNRIEWWPQRACGLQRLKY